MRFRRASPPPSLVIAERFAAPVSRLAAVVLPLDVVARQEAVRRQVFLLADVASDVVAPADYRTVTLSHSLSPEESLRLEFAPFPGAPGASYLLGVLALSGGDEPTVDVTLRALRSATAGRPSIALDCRGDAERTAPGLLIEERGMAVFRLAAPGGSGARALRPVHGLDVFWCDAHGLYLKGWVHAHEHRVRALAIESAGRSTRVEAFTDRPDLLAFYPEHEHVRHAGFAVYLACPPGHPVHLTLTTDGGSASLPLPLPEGPLPPWPDEGEHAADDLSPLLERFVELTNAQGGRVLQVGSRSPAGHGAAPPRPALRGPVTGLDIHPGFSVDLVSDAHRLCLRDRSFGALVSASVLEHLEAPWLFAAEANRVLKMGGLLYHAAPGAWPAHAQPNDFWRMSAAGLQVLFGPDSGFEVLDARDSGRAVLLPSPSWRHRHLDMPTVPIFALAEILARKVEDLPPGAVAWPRRAGSEERARRYPVAGLRLPPDAPDAPGPRGGKS
jgi:SAM-dependent methyltransferase